MAGRRARATVNAILAEAGLTDAHVVITGLSNSYSDYITTPEEYEMQRYEAASTIYGPNTLAGYQQEFSKLAVALMNNATVPSGTAPPDYRDEMISLIADPATDTVPAGVEFGDLYSGALMWNNVKNVFQCAMAHVMFCCCAIFVLFCAVSSRFISVLHHFCSLCPLFFLSFLMLTRRFRCRVAVLCWRCCLGHLLGRQPAQRPPARRLVL